MQRKKWVKILGDQQLMSPFTEQESAYILEHWLAYGLHSPEPIYAAVIVANDVFSRLVSSQVQHEAKASILTYRLFEHEAAAATWLRQVG